MFEIGQFVLFTRTRWERCRFNNTTEIGVITAKAFTGSMGAYTLKSLRDGMPMMEAFFDWQLELASDGDVLICVLER